MVPTPTIERGMTIGKYRVIQPLGRGGMGRVWEVEDRDGRRYALKLPDSVIGGEAAMRLAREANALRMLDHENLVAAVDVFTEAGALVLVMEKVVGRSLTERLSEGPVHPRAALVLARQLLDGIGHAHARGIVHRDLKPDHVMLVDMGGWERVKILDFGILKLTGEPAQAIGSRQLTSMGTVVGTPAYMSPEQTMGKPLDGRSDLYSSAIILFEMLAGRVPFEHGNALVQMQMHCKAPLPRLDHVTRGARWCTPQLIAVVEGGLAKDPDHRFRDAATMIAALDDAFASLDHVV